MWIEYELNFRGKICKKGMFNTQHIRNIHIEYTEGGLSSLIEIYFDSELPVGLFADSDKSIVNEVWNALSNAIAGKGTDLGELGFIRPLERQFMIPSNYTVGTCSLNFPSQPIC